jgi:hypothetical protein
MAQQGGHTQAAKPASPALRKLRRLTTVGPSGSRG